MTAQVRFQSRSGCLLAAASENALTIFDVETDTKTLTLQVSCLLTLTIFA